MFEDELSANTVTPAMLVLRHLYDQAIIVSHDNSLPVWVGYLGHMPSASPSPTEAVAAYDTVGVKDGRYMEGKEIVHEGVQIRVRSVSYLAGYAKAKEIAAALEAIAGLTIDPSDFVLVNCSLQSPPAFIGLEEGTPRRSLFTINYLITMKESE